MSAVFNPDEAPVLGVQRANVGNKRGQGRATCSVGGCDSIVKGRHLCQKHYMRARRHHGDVTAGEERYGNGWAAADGYISTARTGHVLARAKGQVQMHRLILFDKIGFGPHLCYWCRRPINWAIGPAGQYTLVVDHLDEDLSNNDPSNLVPSCHRCNTWGRYYPEIVERMTW